MDAGRVLAVLAALAAGLAFGAPEPAPDPGLVGRFPNGSTIILSHALGPCVNGARLATWIAAGGATQVRGCYKPYPDDGYVSIGWFDGDYTTVSLKAFKAPRTL